MLIVDLALFGALGLTVWAVQMMWIPVTAAGIINGAGHYWGYRNFEAHDASTNISFLGASSSVAKSCTTTTTPTPLRPSCRSSPMSLILGWAYIRILQALGLAKCQENAPKLAFGDIQPVADEKTLEAVIANRYEVMANYARQMRVWNLNKNCRRCRHCLQTLCWPMPSAGCTVILKKSQPRVMEQLAQAARALPSVDTMVSMREELRQLWLNTHLQP
jgi:stearoyl-CoA desaturase (delta-9 desaturase)